MDREQRKEYIAQLCGRYNCEDKIRKIHFQQFVEKSDNWHPHPEPEFLEWWKRHAHSTVKPVVAWNCETYREQWRQEKIQYGT